MILHVITNFTANAGAETMLARLLKLSTAERTLVVSLMEVSARNRVLAANPRVEYLPLGVRSPAGMLVSAVPLRRILAHKRPDVVLCWMYHAMVVGSLAASSLRHPMPVYWNVRQSLDDYQSLTKNTRIALRASRSLSRQPQGIIFNSARALELHRNYGYRNSNCVVIPNGFDCGPALDPAHRRQRVLGIAARFHPQKDHGTFFKAAALVRSRFADVRFAVAGEGMEWDNPQVVRLVRDANLDPDAVDLRGECQDMHAFYADVDALVLSSRTEGFPNVVAEAMACARPAVVTDTGDSAAIVGDTGFVVPASDPSALAEAMTRMLELSPETYAHHAASARRRIETVYDIDSICTRYGEVLLHSL